MWVQEKEGETLFRVEALVLVDPLCSTVPSEQLETSPTGAAMSMLREEVQMICESAWLLEDSKQLQELEEKTKKSKNENS